MKRVVLATRNRHKVVEIAALIADLGWELVGIDDVAPDTELVEDEPTFEGNALAKARQAAAATGLPALADDSGLEVDALVGAPGVRSARYAGEHATDEDNLAKLLREAPAGSPVAYVCAIAYVGPGEDGRPVEHVVEERCEGTLAAEPRGDGGFGYDPAFVPHEFPDRTMAELPPEEKHAISHRGKAARAFLAWLR